MRQLLLGIGISLALGLVLAGFVLGPIQNGLEPRVASADEARTASFVIEPGSSLRRVAHQLEDRQLIGSALAFEFLARWRGEHTRLQAGEYSISSADDPARILQQFVRGRVTTYEVALPEGWTAREIAARLEERGLVDGAAFLAVANDPAVAEALGVEGDSLEGYLFPETYRLPRGLAAREVAEVLVDQFLEAWAPLAESAAAQGLLMREVVTLASIVEKETGAAEERPLIAGVFRNRLERGMRLESDPTTIYGIPDFDGNLRRRDLENGDNPYNTYKIEGLPPGPIANPGAAALEAVLDPAESEYLFFVSKNNGTHVFAKTFDEHERNVDHWQRRGRR